jgi:GNAT superfamily N-acetyltransferase
VPDPAPLISPGWQLRLCRSDREIQEFENLAEDLWGSWPGFVPLFPGTLQRFLGPHGEFQRAHATVRAWILQRESRPVGRIAAIVNHTHNIYHGDRTGFFGFLVCEDDPAAASFLLETARTWLREQGCTEVRGPYNPSINEECGVLLDSFDQPPSIGMTWNPPFLPGLLSEAGWELVREMAAFRLDLTLAEPERVRRIREYIARRSSLKLRQLHLRNLPAELEKIWYLYNTTLDRNWGFVPLRYLDLQETASELRLLADPEIILLAERQGAPAAFAISLPNFHEWLLRARRLPRCLRRPYLLLGLLSRRYRTGRLAVLGVAPEFRDRGLTGWLFGELKLRAARRYREAEISWVEMNNSEILENSFLMGAELYRRYGIFSRPVK